MLFRDESRPPGPFLPAGRFIGELARRLRRRLPHALLMSALLTAMSGTAFADRTPVKDGLPCVEEVCIGDDIRGLSHIVWEPATFPSTEIGLAHTRVSAKAFKRVARDLRGPDDALQAVAPYWVAGRFDEAGLRALQNIEAVCVTPGVDGRLKGQYRSGNNFFTVVSIEPVAGAANDNVRFVVASIHRYLADGISAERARQIGKVLQSRYEGMPMYATVTRAAAAWLPQADPPHLRLLAPVGDFAEQDFNLRSHPACAGARSQAAMHSESSS